jgi:hypothetical protein
MPRSAQGRISSTKAAADSATGGGSVYKVVLSMRSRSVPRAGRLGGHLELVLDHVGPARPPAAARRLPGPQIGFRRRCSGDQPAGLALFAADQDRRVGPLQRLGPVEGLDELVVPAVVGPSSLHLCLTICRVSSRRSNRSASGRKGTPRPRCSRSCQAAPMPRTSGDDDRRPKEVKREPPSSSPPSNQLEHCH